MNSIKNRTLFLGLIMSVFSFFSCTNENNESNRNILLKEPNTNYNKFLLIKNSDTSKIMREINTLITLEKLPFVLNNKSNEHNDWLVIKLDEKIPPYLFFLLACSSYSSEYESIIGVGLNTQDKSISFYTLRGGKTQDETGGEYVTGRLEKNLNFKFYAYSQDSLNFTFESVESNELKKPLKEFLQEKGFDINYLRQEDLK